MCGLIFYYFKRLVYFIKPIIPNIPPYYMILKLVKKIWSFDTPNFYILIKVKFFAELHRNFGDLFWQSNDLFKFNPITKFFNPSSPLVKPFRRSSINILFFITDHYNFISSCEKRTKHT